MKTIEEFKKEYLNSNLHIEDGEYPDTTISNTIDDTLEFAQRWIPVEEELPEIEEQYLVKEKHGISLLWFNTHYNCWDDEEGDDYYSDSVGGKVTHWRPIELK